MTGDKLKNAILGMALDRRDDNAAFGQGFTREAIAEHARPLVDELVAEGLIEAISIYQLTEAGERRLIANG